MEKIKILVVEDEEKIASQIRRNLEQQGYLVQNYASGEKALEHFALFMPDLVLMDMKLEGEWDGIETARRIRQKYTIPILFLTAYYDEHLLQGATESQAYGYLLKPFDKNALYVAIQIAIYKAKIDAEKEKLTCELKAALEKVKLLSGLLPICASCKKIRDDKGYWNRIESYIEDHSEAEFTHSICPQCKKKLYPEFGPP